MPNTYILDTSALITDPQCLNAFPDSNVVIPVGVLEELDKLKTSPGERGKNCRVVIRMLDELSNIGDIDLGVLLENNSLLKVEVRSYSGQHGDASYVDNRIIDCCKRVQKDFEDDIVTLVSNDINLRVRAKALGLDAQGFDKGDRETVELYSGIKSVISTEAIEELYEKKSISGDEYGLEAFPNQFISFLDDEGAEVVTGKKSPKTDTVRLMKDLYPWDLSPRNKEQKCAIDLIMDPNVSLVTLIGQAGTGKTLVTLAAALELVLNRKEYEKLVIYRPMESVGKEIGFLPGDLSEKIGPWFEAIMDNFEVLFGSKHKESWKKQLEMYQAKGRIEMNAMTFIRGRSIPNALIMIDETQNVSKDEIKTILTRAGVGTKIILTGDIDQIDNRNLDAMNNGLTYVIEKFKNSHLAGHVTLTQGERSELATEAARIL
jgi:PhoH-like ATPase